MYRYNLKAHCLNGRCPYSVVVSADQDRTPIVRSNYCFLRNLDTVFSQ